MLNWVRQLKQAISPRTRLRRFWTTPRIFQTHLRYAFRQMLMPEFILPVWVTVPNSGTRLYLSNDPIDDKIAREIVSHPDRLFPKPDALTSVPGAILDVGGHHGLYAAEALHRFCDRRFIVVEPHPLWCQLIRKNLAANEGIDRARVVNACLAAGRGKRMLRFDPNSSWGATVQMDGMGKAAVEVDALTLPEILQGELLAMIYCNAEGAEYTLVAQMREHNIRPALMVISVHPEYGDADILRRQVRDMGYLEHDVSSNSKRLAFHYTRQMT